MTFNDLLIARDAALAHKAECKAAIEPSRAKLQELVTADLAAGKAVVAAQFAIHSILKERGEFHITDERGTVTTYRVVPTTDDCPGYISSHPIPGFEPISVAKPQIIGKDKDTQR